MKQLFDSKINEIEMELGGEKVLVRRVQEFDNGTVSGGSMDGYDHNNLDEFLKEKGYEHYLIAGRYNCFISHVDSNVGYKFFAVDKINNTPADESTMTRMFNIHKDLNEKGFGPKPISLLGGSFMMIEKSIGGLEEPDKEWVSNIIEYCKQKKIYRNTDDAADLAWEVQKRTNVIKTEKGYHFIDVDYKMEYYG
tara:strand:- start:1283 stop:1864 length:582 start_codon:yes stop_codon:yes gene_type:complete